MDTQTLKRLLEVRGEIECSELYQDMAEASVCVRTGDKNESEYLPKGLWIASENGLRPALRGTL